MWLLNARTHRLEYHEGNRIPHYGILSHRWGRDEVTFADVMDGTACEKKGWRKVMLCCEMALQYETSAENQEINFRSSLSLSHVWIDTCCIDKSNSAELSEAINSMYKWYETAVVCFAYLEDVSKHDDIEQFRESSWFTRGWTLQELLAPAHLIFYDCDFRPISTRRDLSAIISSATDIPELAMTRQFRQEYYSVADKMSWTSRRQTTREEDRAYSLLGLFGVNLPLIYGEGPRAFRRLQEEILRTTNDLTVFAWWKPQIGSSLHFMSSNLALCPDWFDKRGYTMKAWTFEPGSIMHNFSSSEGSNNHKPWMVNFDDVQGCTISALGMELSIFMVPFFRNVYFAPLCSVRKTTDLDYSRQAHMGMFLRRLPRGVFTRLCVLDRAVFDAPIGDYSGGRTRRVVLPFNYLHIAQSASSELPITSKDRYGFDVQSILTPSGASVRLFSRVPYDTALNGVPFDHYLAMARNMYGIAGVVRIRRPGQPQLWIVLGFDFDFSPFCLIVIPPGSEDVASLPEDERISIPRLGIHDVSLGNNHDICELVAAVQKDTKYNYDLEKDNFEAHIAPWQDLSVRSVYSLNRQVSFLITNVGSITIGKSKQNLVQVEIDVRGPGAARILRPGITNDPVDNISGWHESTYKLRSEHG